MERDEGKFFYCSSFIACEQALLFGQAKRTSRKCANEGPFSCPRGFAARLRVLARLASLAQIGELARRLSLPWGLHEFPRASTYPRSSLTPKKVRVCILKDYKHIVKKNPVARSKISTLIKSPRYFFQWIFNLSTVTSYS